LAGPAVIEPGFRVDFKLWLMMLTERTVEGVVSFRRRFRFTQYTMQ
jgi:hypothetical protein